VTHTYSPRCVSRDGSQALYLLSLIQHGHYCSPRAVSQKRSANGPDIPDQVRTFIFSVQVFRTFFWPRVDQRWTFLPPGYLLPISKSATQIWSAGETEKSGHGPGKADHVRTFYFSVQVFRTFFCPRVDQRWTFWPPEYLPPISKSATQIWSAGETEKSGHGPEKVDRLRPFCSISRCPAGRRPGPKPMQTVTYQHKRSCRTQTEHQRPW
jgi:hypothetical protein